MKQLELVTGVRVWDFPDRENPGRQVQGAKLCHTTGRLSSEDNHFGIDVTESQIPLELGQSLKGKLPALCEVEYEFRQGKKAVELKPVAVRVLESVELGAHTLLSALQVASS